MKLRINDDYIICEYCNKAFQSLPRHLEKIHGITAWEYKEEFGLNKNQPLECRNLTETRRKYSKKYKSIYKKNFKNNKKYQFKKGYKQKIDYREQFKINIVKNIQNNVTKESEKRRKIKLRKRAIKENWISRITKIF